MKKTIAILLAVFIVIGVCYSHASIKRKRDDKTEQTKPSSNEANRQQEVTPSPTRPVPDYNGHEYVDLGLPSGLKWATCNVGASAPEEYGNYYAWGETTIKSSYDWENSLTWDKSESELKSAGIINSAGNLTMSYDAARSTWGGSWRMPTEQEWEELVNKCTWTLTSQGGHIGYRVMGRSRKSIFIPAAGYRAGTSLDDAGERGYYWSSTCYVDSYNAYSVYLSSFGRYVGWDYRYYGRAVRAVSE